MLDAAALEVRVDVRRLDSGRTLVTLFNGGRVVEVDRAGKVHWEIKGLRSPRTAQRLEDGNTLVAEEKGQVAEWIRDGYVAWEHRGLHQPCSAERLSNGNTLIALYGQGGGVREVDRQGKFIWQMQMDGVTHVSRF